MGRELGHFATLACAVNLLKQAATSVPLPCLYGHTATLACAV